MFRNLFLGVRLLLGLGVMTLGVTVTAPCTGAATVPTRQTLSQGVVQVALSRVGKPTAEPGAQYTCANFADWVMHQVGAKSTGDFGVSGNNPNLNFKWGNLIVQHNAGRSDSDFNWVQPGDVFQYRNVQGPGTGGLWQMHTAIVYQNLGGGRFVVLEQNVNDSNGRPQQFVTRDTIDLSDMTRGTVWVYRPVPK